MSAGVEPLAIYCADVGSVPGGNFGWARRRVPTGVIEEHGGDGAEIGELVASVARDLATGTPVALGFECPLFVPVPEESLRLGAARSGEGTRAWSAGAGTGALATGLVQAAWVLDELRRRRPRDSATLDWVEFAAGRAQLYLWEAFVTAQAKAATHVGDAEIAVDCFASTLPDPRAANHVAATRPLSLIGAAMLWAGWSDDAGLLMVPCLVQRAEASPEEAMPGPSPGRR